MAGLASAEVYQVRAFAADVVLASVLDRSVCASKGVSQKRTNGALGIGTLSLLGSGGESQGNGRMWRVAHLGGDTSQSSSLTKGSCRFLRSYVSYQKPSVEDRERCVTPAQ